MTGAGINQVDLAWVSFAPVNVQKIDENHQLYGNFIGVQFVFEQALDATCLVEAIDHLIMQHPELTGRYDRKSGQVIPSSERIRLRFQSGFPGSAKDHAVVGTRQNNRGNFIFEPSRREVQSGKAALSSFTLTEFQGGGCILGIAISHVLVDAAGFHLIARYLGHIYSQKIQGQALLPSPLISELGVFKFGTDRSKRKMLKALKSQGLAKPLKLRGLLGGFVRRLIVKTLDKMSEHPRVVIAFTPEKVERLKQTVLRESGADWVSTNMALCAHFTSVLGALMFSEDSQDTVQIAQLLDLRGRYFEEDGQSQNLFTRNAILIHTECGAFPNGLHATPRGALAGFFKTAHSRIQPLYIKDRLNLIADCLGHGYSYPGLDFKTPMIALNNQSKMNVYATRFGAPPLRVIPQDVGDNIMFFPAPDGGVEIYIRDIQNPEIQEHLLSPQWQARIFDF